MIIAAILSIRNRAGRSAAPGVGFVSPTGIQSNQRPMGSFGRSWSVAITRRRHERRMDAPERSF